MNRTKKTPAQKLSKDFEANLICDFEGKLNYVSQTAKQTLADVGIVVPETVDLLFKDSIDEKGQPISPDLWPHRILASGAKSEVFIVLGLPSAKGEFVWLQILGESRYSKLGLPPSITLFFKQSNEIRMPLGEYPEFNTESVLETLEEGYLLLNSEYKVKYFNRKAALCFHQVTNDYLTIGKWLLAGTKLDFIEFIKELALKCLENHHVEQSFSIVRNNEQIVFEFQCTPYYRDQHVTGVIFKIKDISASHRLKAELEFSNERFALAAKASYDLIWERNFINNTYKFSDQYHSIFGYNPEEVSVPNVFIETIVHPEDRQLFRESKRKCLSAKKGLFDFPRIRFVTKDGDVRYVKIRSVFSYDQFGIPKAALGFVHDITEKYLQDQELLRLNEKFSLAAKASLDVIWEYDVVLDRFQFSDAFYRNFGYETSREWSYDEFMSEVVHHDDLQMIRSFLRKELESKSEILHFPKHRYWNSVGEVKFVEAHMHVVHDDQQIPVRYIDVIRDITAAELLTQSLEEAVERYETVSKATSDLIFEILPEKNKMLFWNNIMKEKYGFKTKNSVEIAWFKDHIHPEDVNRITDYFKSVVLKKSSGASVEFRFRDNKGAYRDVLIRSYIIYDSDGNVNRVIGAMQDLSTVYSLEKRIIEETLIFQRKLNENTIITEEKERESFAKELHDNINQLLSVVILYQSIASSDEKARSEMIEKSKGLLHNIVQEIRSLTHKMISPVLDTGLEAALQQLSEETEKVMSISIHFKAVDFDNNAVSKDVQLMLYRIVQEQLNNIMKYAEASIVNIGLYVSNGKLHLNIKDNGKGFDMKVKSKGVGLRNMKSRVEAYHGTVEFLTSINNGFEIAIKIPVS